MAVAKLKDKRPKIHTCIFPNTTDLEGLWKKHENNVPHPACEVHLGKVRRGLDGEPHQRVVHFPQATLAKAA